MGDGATHALLKIVTLGVTTFTLRVIIAADNFFYIIHTS